MPTQINIAQKYASLFQEGDESALAFFYREFHPALTLFSFHWVKDLASAQEIASDAFIKTWPMRSKLGTYAGIRAYLYKVVRRDSQRALKQQNKQPDFLLTGLDSHTTSDSPFEYLVRSETYRLIHSAIKSLPPGYQKVITMHFMEGKSTGEIARELKASVNTVKAQKLKGLKALRKKIVRTMFILFALI